MRPAIDRGRYEAAARFDAYLDSVIKHADLWRGVFRTASIDAEAVERLRGVSGAFRLLALSEDWCSDCFSTLPVIARLAELSGIDCRVVGRDANPDLIETHLSSGTRSIPVIMVLDAEYQECGWWGPRPAVLQRWFRNEAVLLRKEDQSRRKRAWYARDRGKSAVREIVDMIERAARSRNRGV